MDTDRLGFLIGSALALFGTALVFCFFLRRMLGRRRTAYNWQNAVTLVLWIAFAVFMRTPNLLLAVIMGNLALWLLTVADAPKPVPDDHLSRR